jgi:outer membrane lipoprotein-sorting protein
MRRKMFFMTLVVILLISLSTISFAITGRDVIDKAKGFLDKVNSMHALMGMDLIDKDGTVNSRTMEVWGVTYDQQNNLSKLVMEFQAPASVKGTRFLQIENSGRSDDKWIYLPALGRVRRIASSEGNSSFMGSDFTYDDLSNRDVDKDNNKLLREEKLGDYDCYVVESTPKELGSAQYSKRITWVTKDQWIPLRIEMYSKKTGKLEKLLTVDQNMKKIDGIWTVFSAVMTNKETGHSTKLYIKGPEDKPYIEYNKKISDQRFTQRFLKTGR